MTNKEAIENIEKCIRIFPYVFKDRVYEQGVTRFSTPIAKVDVYPTDFMITMGRTDHLCAVKLARLSDITMGKLGDGWYLHVYLKGKDDDFFNIRIA